MVHFSAKAVKGMVSWFCAANALCPIDGPQIVLPDEERSEREENGDTQLFAETNSREKPALFRKVFRFCKKLSVPVFPPNRQQIGFAGDAGDAQRG